MVAISHNMPDIALRILEVPGVDVNVLCRQCWTPLLVALSYNMPQVAHRILDDPGVDVDAGMNEFGQTALVYAIDRAMPDVALPHP